MLNLYDKVRFKREVLARTQGHGQKMVGTIVALHESTAMVETNGTWVSEEGRSVRCIPLANLEKVPDAKN
jgi:hypothetical protein